MDSLASAELEAFRGALEQSLGFRWDDDRMPTLAGVLASRLQHTGATASAYLRRLPEDRKEIAELSRSLSVSETYFLRNPDQFRALEAILIERQRTPRRYLRMLSAGCSSGEEAYSLAITAREVLHAPSDWTLLILGVDVNPDSVEKARGGIYGSWALRETPPIIREKYFRPVGARFAISGAIRSMVAFDRQNLVRPERGLWTPEAYDIVFCRNVLMYLTPRVASEVVEQIARSLTPGGFLFLGHAETLRGLSDAFQIRHSHNTFYYEVKAASWVATSSKGEAEASETSASDGAQQDGIPWFDAIARSSNRIERLSRSTPTPQRQPVSSSTRPADDSVSVAMQFMADERFQAALEVLRRADDPDPGAALLEAVLLVCTGRFVEAERVCEGLLGSNTHSAGAHYVIAICREHAGDKSGALDHCRTSAYLDASFAMPHLQIGRIARQSADLETARRALHVALTLLPGEDPARIALFGGGFGRDALISLCRAELVACGGAL